MMKFKSLLISVLVCASVNAHADADAGAFVVGIILGSALTQPHHQPPVYVQSPPQEYYQQAPVVVIREDQAAYYDPRLHGYCATYRDELYAQCVGNITRKKQEDAYRRGLYGY